MFLRQNYDQKQLWLFDEVCHNHSMLILVKQICLHGIQAREERTLSWKKFQDPADI